MLDTLGWVAYLRGRYAQALPPLRRAIEQRPTRTSVHHHLGAVYHALGQFGWARYHLEQASSGPAVDPAAMRARELLMRTP
jgi:Flp pilus assembly protein TadD